MRSGIYERAISCAQYFREVCLEAAGAPKYGFMAGELFRMAEMWERFIDQVRKDERLVAESREFLSRMDKQFGL